MRFLRLVAARALLALAGLADGALAMAEPTVLRTMLARLALRGARLFAGLAVWIAPWIRADQAQPLAPGGSSPTYGTIPESGHSRQNLRH
ncbi:hypothetical protein A1351_06770 [Methylosinus sp. R-45379]|uniref:hypothetical protein n=1 Tax=unclassified Methylosinus TaxID=2624500 RepID=UPI0004658699|nr:MULTISPECIES: hypothetical protein [unclassified Methylosinus]OAI30987.1 hypothetical protein A1351_06770 [Methylosinus sp. R-45379]